MKPIFASCLIFVTFFSLNAQAELPVLGRTDALKNKQKEKGGAQDTGKEIIFKSSTPIETRYKVKMHNGEEQLCEVEIASEYGQSGDNLDVEAIIDNSQCGASKGNYIVRVRTRNDQGESHTSRYQESWTRDDFESIKATHVYSMKGDTDLINVQIQMPLDGYCVCLTENEVQ